MSLDLSFCRKEPIFIRIRMWYCVVTTSTYFSFLLFPFLLIPSEFCFTVKNVIRFVCTINRKWILNFFFFRFSFLWFQIMALLAPIIGAEKTKEFFLQKYLELCVNEHYDVRKMCAVYCPHLCKVLGRQASEEYLVNEFPFNGVLNRIRNDGNWCFMLCAYRFRHFWNCAKTKYGTFERQRPTPFALWVCCARISVDGRNYARYFINWWTIHVDGCTERPPKA